MPLTMLNPGEERLIKKIVGRDETKKFLENLGCIIGTKVEIVSGTRGNIIVKIRGARLALDRDLAKRILV